MRMYSIVPTTEMIFVFGSNLSGIHGAGAAKTAHHQYGAKWGVGQGICGNSYALPTKGVNISHMTLKQIKKGVDKFLRHAVENSDDEFLVTAVGTGLASHDPEKIAKLFLDAPSNCFFDTKWKQYLGPDKNYWGTFR